MERLLSGASNPKLLRWSVVGVPLAEWHAGGVGRDPVTFRSDWLLGSLPSGMPALGRPCKVK